MCAIQGRRPHHHSSWQGCTGTSLDFESCTEEDKAKNDSPPSTSTTKGASYRTCCIGDISLYHTADTQCVADAVPRHAQDIVPGTPFPISWDTDEIAKHREAYPRLTEYKTGTRKSREGHIPSRRVFGRGFFHDR